MRLSRLFGKTLRQEPAEAETESHRLLLKAGLIYPVAAGVYGYLPLAWRALRKIEAIIRQEMDAVGAQEVMLPILQPAELWKATGRSAAFGETLFTLQDRRGRSLVLGPTHEEVITEMVRRHVRSYKDLPLLLYQIQVKLRDEPRPRGGLIRAREFAMNDLYSFHADEEDLEKVYQRVVQAYRNIFSRCGLEAMAVEADSGAIGGKDSHEFMVIAPSGENEVMYCGSCPYAANVERAEFVKPPQNPEGPLPLEEIRTPGIKTIEELSRFLGIPQSKTLKAVFYSADGEVVFVTIRGDLEVNEVKLKNALKAKDLRLATEDEVARAGLVAGSASAINLRGIRSVADDSITLGANFVVGANKPDTHLRNANYPRDFQVGLLTDIATAKPGHACPRCGGQLQSTRGIEVGHVFKLGTFFSKVLGAYFLDQTGTQQPIIMGCYGIGLGRLLAAALEQNHDQQGIRWPVPIAPYQVHLVTLGESAEVIRAGDRLYEELTAAGLEVLYDDRAESAGVKFNDADLLGLPVRLVLSPRTLASASAEVKPRSLEQGQLLPLAELAPHLTALLGSRG